MPRAAILRSHGHILGGLPPGLEKDLYSTCGTPLGQSATILRRPEKLCVSIDRELRDLRPFSVTTKYYYFRVDEQ